jgi:ribosomal protein S18 acetylase RimI-like enzyme
MSDFAITAIHAPNDLERFRALLLEYAESMPGRFSNRINEDLAALPGRYSAPTGALLLATLGNTPIGTAAWTQLPGDAHTHQVEIKRVYVTAAQRGHGYGKALSDAVIADTRARGYRELVLSTWEDNAGAIALYRTLGFRPIAPFKTSPISNLIYMGLSL